MDGWMNSLGVTEEDIFKGMSEWLERRMKGIFEMMNVGWREKYISGWTDGQMDECGLVIADLPPTPHPTPPSRQALNFTGCPLTLRLLSGGGQKTLTEKVSLPFSHRPSEGRGLHPVYC